MESEPSVLIIEDNESVFGTLKEAFRPITRKVWRAKSGKEALKLLKNLYFPVIFTEVQVSDMNGIELIKRIKKIDSRVNIVALTTQFLTDLRVRALQSGAYAYLMKPVDKEEACLTLKRALENVFLMVQAGKRKYYQDMSILDGLTGVYNHRHFYEMLDWQITHMRRVPQAFSVFMIDIDNFKKYNDTKGHPEGDKVLHDAAQLFVDLTRENDMVFRYGGEEFAIILPQTEQHNAKKVGDRLVEVAKARLPVTISVGLSTFLDHAQTRAEIVANADKALYRAKTTGKNKLCVYDRNLDK